MPKYSFIVPVYNTAKYLKTCINSILKQNITDFEIIIVNDGSTDSSKRIISELQNKDKRIIIINQKNMGLSEARNNGVLKARGKYILFVDSDDYIEKDLLKNIDKSINDVNVLRYQIIEETDKGKIEYKEEKFNKTSGVEAFKNITKYHYVEPACCYVFEREYFINNKFKFKPNVYHEDYGLIPYVIYCASSVKSIDFLGYHYIKRKDSIMNNSNYDKTLKKVYDMYNQYLDVKKKIKNKKDNYLLSYLANCAIIKGKELNVEDKNKYFEMLKKDKIYDDILSDTLIRKVKKIIMKISFNLYLKVVR